ncbi:hypothetical protein SALB1_1491 [Salinisphaera sp. LB1]|nr:hypothetical protein SALB1_1491 [Salinisphaera sp. LB1]
MNLDAGRLAGHDLLAVEVTAVGDYGKFIGLHRRTGSIRHRLQLRAIVADVGDLMIDDQVMFGIDADWTL